MNATSEPSIILSDLNPWTEYTVKVRGYNAEGDGPFGVVAKEKTYADGKNPRHDFVLNYYD